LIYNDDNGYIELPKAMECAFRAAINAKTGASDAKPKLYRNAAGQEIVWMRSFLGELSYSFDAPSLLLVDKQLAIQVACNPKHHGRMKHLNLQFFWLRNMVSTGVITVRYIPTADMAANLLTKALTRVKLVSALHQLDLTAP
jgi:hypothetical protein